MFKFTNTIFILLSLLIFSMLNAQEIPGGAPGGKIVLPAESNKQPMIHITKSTLNPDEFVYSTTTYTFTDLVVFSYFDGSEFFLINSDSLVVDSVQLDENQYHVFSPGEGVYTVEGNISFTLLIGDPITKSCMGYFAVDESGSPLSTRLNTYMPAFGYNGEHFIVFSYNNQTEFYIKNLSDTSITIAAGVLNKGEHFQLDGHNSKFLGVYSNKPVSALSYTDQGYFVPSGNGTFTGCEFYGFSGYVGGWENGIVVTAYSDSTDYIAVNSITGDTLMQGRIDAGETASLPVYSDTYWELYTNYNVTACNTPYAGYSGKYYYLTRQIDESGQGIGTNFYTPVISGSIDLFSYEDDNSITIYNINNPDTVWTGILNAGDRYHFNSTKTVYHFTSSENIAVISSYGGGYGADFVPLNFAVALPDLSLSSDDITFDPGSVEYNSGDPITIFAVIHNNGFETAYDVEVQFFDGDPEGGLAISPVMTADSILSKSSYTFNHAWTVPAYPQYHAVYVVVDFEKKITESNKSNNTAFKFIIPNNDLLPPLATTVDAPASVKLEADTLEFTDFQIKVNVFNSGSVEAESVLVKLNLPPQLSINNPADSVKYLGNIPANQSAAYTWQVHIDSITQGDAYFYSILVDADNAEAKPVERMLLINRPTAIDENISAAAIPHKFILYANFPNPFNPSTSIEYSLHKGARVLLEVYDICGRKVCILVNGFQNAGRYKTHFHAKNLVSGVYFLRFNVNDKTVAVNKMMLIK